MPRLELIACLILSFLDTEQEISQQRRFPRTRDWHVAERRQTHHALAFARSAGLTRNLEDVGQNRQILDNRRTGPY